MPDLRDELTAGAFVAWALGEIALGAVSGPWPVDAVAAVVATVPLAWRRSRPEVAAVSALAVAAKSALGLPLDGMALLTALFVASYSLGRHLPARRGGTLVVAMVAAVCATLWRVPATGVYDWMFAALWIGGPGAAGAVLRHQLVRAAALAERAARADLLREEHVRAALDAERDRIARELHDTVAHAVSVMVLQAGVVRGRLPDQLSEEREALGGCEETGRRAIADLRRMLGLLRSDRGTADLAPQPTLARVDSLLAESRRLGLDVRLDVRVHGGGEPPALEPSMEASAYRIVQEALTNVRKHSLATAATVTLEYAPDRLRVTVADNGRPRVRAQRDHRGFGLLGIRERVDLYQGTFSAGPRGDAGFVVEATLPTAVTA